MNVMSIRDLLLLVTSFSLLSLYLTYQLGFPSARFRAATDPTRQGHISSFRTPQFYHLLRRAEKRQVKDLRQHRKVAIVKGQIQLLQRDLALYSKALQSKGFVVRTSSSRTGERHSFTPGSTSHLRGSTSSPDDEEDWTLMLCIAFTDGDSGECLPRDEFLNLKPSQKVNRIPGLRNVLWKKNGLCRTTSHLGKITSLQGIALSPLCFTLPDQYEEFLNAADGPSFNHSWVLKSITPGGKLEHLSTMEFFNRVRLKEFSDDQEILVQQFFPNQLSIFGYPITVHVFVLITSVSPLRIYVHNEGFVTFRYGDSKNFKKVPGKIWFLSQLWQHMASTFGPSSVKMASENADNLIVQLMLGAEAFLMAQLANFPVRDGEHRYRCQNCFQLLSVELLYNTSFSPVIIEVNGQPNMQESVMSENWPLENLKLTVVKDMLSLVFGRDIVHNDVYKALESTAEDYNIGVMGLNCLISHDLCLTQEDFEFLLATRRESLNMGDFRRLYPSSSGNRYEALIQEMQLLMLQNTDNTFNGANWMLRETYRHSTGDMHNLLSRMAVFFGMQEPTEDDYAYLAEPRFNYASFNLQSVHENNPLYSEEMKTKDEIASSDCSGAPSSLYLKGLILDPAVELRPSFTPFWTDYQAEVPYDITMVRISAIPLHCKAKARFEDRFGPLGSLNTTLGVGLNKISILVMESNEGWVYSTYSLSIRRHSASYNEHPFDPGIKHSVCSLSQECDFRFAPTEPCGLQDEPSNSWHDMIEKIEQLPPCLSGDAFGRWILPCVSCKNRSTCTWSLIRWQPYLCSYKYVSREELSQCLSGKKLLFLGDSTNRGMMHYIIERLNGSLADCDKTHDIKVYSRLNQGKTFFSFAYYPQFWLPSSGRPVFEKTLYQLLLKSQLLENTSNTVLIVGGVHWLATQHLHTILRAMRREGLQGARLVVKTLGSGFHIPAEGVHYLSKIQQEKLLLHSAGLVAFARHHHMELVDTFNITAARYKDFLQGKCACHFHKIVQIPTDDGIGRSSSYHVEGPINAIYTEVLLSVLCQNASKPP